MDSINHDELEKKLEDPTAPPMFLPLQFLKHITCSFSTEQELGRGGYGAVYKGILRSQKIIAVKKLFEIHLMEDNQFQNEVSYLMGIRHENVVQLVGYCAESRWEATMLPSGQYVMAQIPTRLLCFEYMCNGGLDKHVTDESSGLDWGKRYDIIKGICSGLHFLHGDCHIVHLDLKPENILMDATMVPKIADFGLSRLLGAQKSRTIISGNFAGSLGYMAPEYLLKGVVSPKADIFSLGAIIIEIITGRRDYPHYTAAYYEDLDNNDSHPSIDISLQKFIDKVIGRWRNIFQTESKYTTPKIYTQQVQQCITIALQCVDHDLRKRPSAGDICESFSSVETTNSQAGHSKDSMGHEISLASKSSELLSVQPLQLRFHWNPEHVSSFCTLHLTNNSDNPVAFRIETQHGSEGMHGLVQSRTTCSCPIKVSEPDDLPILLESTTADQNLLDIKEPDYNQYNRFFIEAKDMGRQVQQVKLSSAIVEAACDGSMCADTTQRAGIQELVEKACEGPLAPTQHEGFSPENTSEDKLNTSISKGLPLANMREDMSDKETADEVVDKLKLGFSFEASTSFECQSKSSAGEKSDQDQDQPQSVSANKETEDAATEINRGRQELSAKPLQLRFHWTPEHLMSSCSLHLTNNTDDPFAFRIVMKKHMKEHFLGPLYGLVPPRSKFTLPVTMCKQIDNDRLITLQSTIADESLQDTVASDSAYHYSRFFLEANKRGRQVQEVKLSAVIVHGLMQKMTYLSMITCMDVHPTESWIITHYYNAYVYIWDYHTQKAVNHSFEFKEDPILASKFIARQQWLLTGCLNGNINVYSYKTMENLKTFKAHNQWVRSLDVHPTKPFVLSASSEDRFIKLWNWEKDWECVRTFDTQANRLRHVRFNPVDPKYFACVSFDDVIQIWNIDTSRSKLGLPEDVPSVQHFDYFTRGDQLYLVTGHNNGSVSIWDWQSRAQVKTLKGHTKAVKIVCVHPDLPILITGSVDGTVRWWSSITFRIEGVLDCGLGEVRAIVCLKGSRRIVIGHGNGTAITEISTSNQVLAFEKS